MWIRKSQQELMSERRKRLLGACIGAVCAGLLLFVFGLPHAGFHFPIGFRIAAMLAAGVMFLAWFHRARGRRVQLAVWVCEQCNVVNANKDQATCACGGKLKSLHEMKWLERPPSREFPGNSPETEDALSGEEEGYYV
jgi:hypothetical protein